MYLLSKLNLNQNNYFSCILALFPLSFIAGNMIININIILFILSAFIFCRSDIFKIKFYFLDKIIITYFLLILFTAVINDYYFFTEKLTWKGYFGTIKKSFFFLKYFFLYIILRFLVEKNLIELKLFFISSTLAVIFVSFDIFYQFFNGTDIFGFPMIGRKLSGPFGDELIAGGFIQRYSLFAFFLVPIFFRKIEIYKFSKLIIPLFLFLILFSSLILSGNRMPLIMFLFTISLVLFFQKNIRKFLFLFLLFFSLVYSAFFKYNDTVRLNFMSFYDQVYKMSLLIKQKNFFNDSSPYYMKEFSSFYNTWLINKNFGGGIKNFRYYCRKRQDIPSNASIPCNMHPHNYYLEILTETGFVGFLITLLIFFNILYLTLIKKYFSNSNIKDNNLITPFIFLFVAEIFPLKNTGSFFTTGNTTYLFLIIGIMIGIVRRYNSIENNK